MRDGPSTLIIPVESQVRELDAKLLLSCVAAERGFPVIMGSRAFVHFKVDSIKRGVYMAKSMRNLSVRMFEILRGLGHEIVAWDEEGLLREPDAEYYRWRLSPITINQVSHLLAWGRDDARTLESYPEYHGGPVKVTGNPRIDLMRRELRDYYRPQVEDIRGRFGEFVLINTNFSKVNHFYSHLSPLKNAMEAKDPSKVNPYDLEWGRHKLDMFNRFKAMMPLLCEAMPEETIVLRPHPAENHGPWREIAASYKNLHIANDGSVTPWLIASKMLIANCCTTQVEASVLDTPSINYQPITSESFDFKIACAVSRCVHTAQELCDTANAIAGDKLGPLDYATRRAALEDHIEGLEGPLAAERMVDVLEAAGYRNGRPPTAPLMDYLHARLHNRLRTAVKQINMRRPGHRNNLAYHAHRWPEITTGEIREKVARLGALLNRFENIRVDPYSRHTYRISSV